MNKKAVLEEDSSAPSTPSRTGGQHLGRRRSHVLMHALMLVTTTCWAGNIIAGKFVLRSMGPLALAQLRAAGGASVFVCLFFARRHRPTLRLSWREWRMLALTALFGISLNQLCFIGGIDRTSAAHAALIIGLGPVMVLVMAVALRLEALTGLKVAGTMIAFSGVAVLTTGKASSGATLRGDLITLVGTLVFAVYTILMKEVAGRYDAITLNALVFSLGAAFMAPVALHELLKVHWSSLPATAWWGAGYLVFMGTALSYIIYAKVLQELSAARVAAYAYLQAMIAVTLGIWLLAEKLDWRVLAGGTSILLGVYLTEREVKEPGAGASTVDREAR